uniref:SMARCD2 protein n=1 Tax=Fopius arisanus TaxID=64838 RepID=A0A0C9QWB2_9HYME
MYRIVLLLWVTVAATQSPYNIDSRGVSFSGKSSNFGPLYTPGLGAVSNGYRDDSYEDNAVTPTPLYRKPTSSSDGTIRIVSGLRGGPPRNGPFDKNAPSVEPLEEEKDEPDRLSLLLPQSKFDCINKQTGYYADEDLNCEVFHYCHENAKHSWICPEGFTFHQVI